MINKKFIVHIHIINMIFRQITRYNKHKYQKEKRKIDKIFEK